MMSGSVSAGGERLYLEGQNKIINVTRNIAGRGRTWADYVTACAVHRLRYEWQLLHGEIQTCVSGWLSPRDFSA